MYSDVAVLDLPFGMGVCAVLISGSRLDTKMAYTNKSSTIFIDNYRYSIFHRLDCLIQVDLCR